MAGDLFASLAPRPILDIPVAGRLFTIPALPARPWLDILLDDTSLPWDIVPGMFAEPDAAEVLTDALIDSSLTAEAYTDLFDDVLEIAAARPPWVTQGLLSLTHDPELGTTLRGQFALHQIDADRVSLPAWLDALYAVITAGASREGRQRFNARLHRPPASKRHRIDRDRQRAAFEELMGS